MLQHKVSETLSIFCKGVEVRIGKAWNDISTNVFGNRKLIKHFNSPTEAEAFYNEYIELIDRINSKLDSIVAHYMS